MLERDGYISDAKEWKKYKEEREQLTADIMKQVRVVCVTTSSAGGTFLKYLPFVAICHRDLAQLSLALSGLATFATACSHFHIVLPF